MYVQQTIQRPQGVNAFGSCLVRATPDYASLRFLVNKVELRREARVRAIRSARAKAEELASAADAKIGPVLHIEDINADDFGRRSHLPDIDHAMHDELGDAAPGSITIAAAVMACFAIVR